MMLEDHLGDILRKARRAAKVTVETAAQVAGLSPVELDALEQSGQMNPAIHLSALAVRVGLDGAKLQQIAAGWLPGSPDLSRWCELRVITTTAQGNAVNCYVVWDEISREAALFDTGWDAQPIVELVTANELQVKHLFLTHGHEDHVAALGPLQEQFPKLRLHSSSPAAQPQHRNRPNDFIHLGSLRITNRDAPGHAEDGVIYIVGTWPDDAPHVAIVGDTVFAGSLANGFVSTEQLKQKVREQIFSLPPDTLLCPGHGPLTTVAEEKAHNPFFT